MNAESLIGWSEAGFLAVGVIAILFLIIRTYHPGSREAMNDHANIIFRGEDAPEPRTPDAPRNAPPTSRGQSARQD